MNYKINIEVGIKREQFFLENQVLVECRICHLLLEPIKLKNTFISGSINEVKTNLSIVKKDAKDENIVIPNVKFNIYDLDNKFIGSYITG